MPAVTNIGGSLTSALALTALAAGVRALRAVSAARAARAARAPRAPGRFHADLSPAALWMLVCGREERRREAGWWWGRNAAGSHGRREPLGRPLQVEADPFPHVVVDVRPPDVSSSDPLPSGLGAGCVPGERVGPWLGGAPPPGAPPAPAAPAPPVPPRHALLVFVDGGDGKAAASAAAAAAAAGRDATAAVTGGARAVGEAADAPPADLPSISADALALALAGGPPPPDPPGSPPRRAAARGASPTPQPSLPRRILLIDVRRHDERALYGSLPGALHIPAERVPSALAAPPSTFTLTHGVPPPGPGDAAVFVSRGATRAAWAALAARDAGVGRTLAFRGGAAACGAACGGGGPVHHEPYALDDPPPEPESEWPPVAVAGDARAAAAELAQLGLAA